MLEVDSILRGIGRALSYLIGVLSKILVYSLFFSILAAYDSKFTNILFGFDEIYSRDIISSALIAFAGFSFVMLFHFLPAISISDLFLKTRGAETKCICVALLFFAIYNFIFVNIANVDRDGYFNIYLMASIFLLFYYIAEKFEFRRSSMVE
jgi:hypothetical protein